VKVGKAVYREIEGPAILWRSQLTMFGPVIDRRAVVVGFCRLAHVMD
jgi:hypothetical protein